jgi:ABC-2 type transport system permease protein
MFRAYFELAVRGYRRYTAYIGATVAGLFTNVAFGLLRAAVMLAVFAANSHAGGYDAAQALSYVWLVQGLMAVVQMFGNNDLAYRVRSGEISTDLLRPLNVQLAFLSTDLGRAAYQVIYRGLPPVVIGGLLFRLALPSYALQWLAFGLSVLLAAVVSYLFHFLYNLSSFWLVDQRGVSLIAVIVLNLFSGFIVPINFFPSWGAAIANATPFPSIIQVPVDIFTGNIHGPSIASALGTQTAWALILFTCGRMAFAAGRRRLVFQGG